MKKRFAIVLSVLLILISLNYLPVSGAEADVFLKNKVSESEINKDKAFSARIENILNNNYVYADAFNTYADIVLNSQLSLLNKAEDGKLKNSDIYAFVKNMYGIDLVKASHEEDFEFNLKAKTEILPRGYTKYTHKFLRADENSDGTVTVYSQVKEERHDSESVTKNAVSVFIKNENSAFGYNLLSCEVFID